ncbi:hypothetical protein [Mesorhizobium sp. B2-3-4]|uniref:hypothetical protein n=1 Tax=Mesorhizobium sp. B2-3-4 TaxID=2589959 RepID=UPI00112D62E2|nr:hypothetical protein [Mesorhizobium sp. B2-3-4]TPM37207.1 hypothetical protein FJ967_17140 [Mesorhizobium sp. B2-3-4]
MGRLRFMTAMLGAMAWCVPVAAHASGHVPVPSSSQEFTSHEACRAMLQEAYDADRKQIAPMKRASNGDTHEVALETKGVESIGPQRARYEATVWFDNGRFDNKLQATETSHTFERHLRECWGKTLRVSGENGFTMSTWDP